MTAAIDLAPEHCETVLALLRKHLPGATAWAYGSRARWTAKPHSDLDLAVFPDPRQAAAVADLREAFEESNLPFRVDLFVWTRYRPNSAPESKRRMSRLRGPIPSAPRIGAPPGTGGAPLRWATA